LDSARCVTKNLLVIRALVRSGACSGVLPAFMCAEFIDDKRLRVTELDYRRHAWLLVQQHLKTAPAARAVIDWVRDCFASLGT
jgi:DNA-binding transcriptional LysR family regulator